MVKREKYKIKEFYMRPIKYLVRWVLIKVFKFWDCTHCNRLHSPRTIRYNVRVILSERHVCSLGKSEIAPDNSLSRALTNLANIMGTIRF